ncbi:MAG: BON domain-containing protein [Chloroflexi bacterium]|nr:BON domain-containing protein [Chloroflexota bacterium]
MLGDLKSELTGPTPPHDYTLEVGRGIQISRREQTVVLRGNVACEEHREFAGRLAARIPGIRFVDNQLEISPN